MYVCMYVCMSVSKCRAHIYSLELLIAESIPRLYSQQHTQKKKKKDNNFLDELHIHLSDMIMPVPPFCVRCQQRPSPT